MYLILQHESPEDFVVAAGVTTSVRKFVRLAFEEIGIEIEFVGQGVNEKGYVRYCSHPDFQLEVGEEVVAIDPKYFQPTEVELLIGDPKNHMTN